MVNGCGLYGFTHQMSKTRVPRVSFHFDENFVVNSQKCICVGEFHKVKLNLLFVWNQNDHNFLCVNFVRK